MGRKVDRLRGLANATDFTINIRFILRKNRYGKSRRAEYLDVIRALGLERGRNGTIV